MMRYNPIAEKPYCCVPAVLQMIQAKRSLPIMSQDEIGWELGLIVPSEIKSKFTRVRTGPMPREGYGTQTSKPEFSIGAYFDRNQLPLSIKRVSPSSLKEMISIIEDAFAKDGDIILCFNSQLLFGDGDLEHVSLIEEFNKDRNQITVLDPAISAPRLRIVTIDILYEAMQTHGVSASGGLWIIFDRNSDT